MSFSSSINRIGEYCRRHGFKATISRASSAIKRELFSGRMIVFYCGLATQSSRAVPLPESARVDLLTSEAELGPEDLQEMTSFWNPKQARRNIKERFAKGASLWLINFGNDLAGYGWTLHGRTIAPYYFPIGSEDVQLCDFTCFPNFAAVQSIGF